MPRPLLIVFGLNGSLLQRARPVVAANLNAPTSVEQFTVGVQKVYVRPGAKKGLQQLLDAGHSLGIWSSTTLKNTEPIVNTVFGDEESKKMFSFVWARDHTKPDIYRRQNSLGDSESEHSTIKDIQLLWDYKLGVKEGTGDTVSFGPHNTVIVDDEPSKTRGHSDNLLWIPQFTVEDPVASTMDETLGFNETTSFLLNELSTVEDVREILPKKIVVKAIRSD
jgi:hypothetical protein